MTSGVWKAFVGVFGGCITSMLVMEYILKIDKGAGNLLTLTELLFVTTQEIIMKDMWRIRYNKGRLLPWRQHIIHAGLWLSMTILVNVVFDYNIAVPIHTLFRSCNIVSSVIVGYMFFNTSYSYKEIFATCIITIGIFLGSTGDMTTIMPNCCSLGSIWSQGLGNEESAGRWTIGIGILVAVLFIQAFLGHIQDRYYRIYSKGDGSTRKALSNELLLYSHIAALIPMVFMSDNIKEHWTILSSTTTVTLPLLRYDIPIGILLVIYHLMSILAYIIQILLNNITQSICISGVFALSANYSPLTVNITLSSRKFLTVMISIYWFSNPWTRLHTIASFMVFGGVALYATVKARLQCSVVNASNKHVNKSRQ